MAMTPDEFERFLERRGIARRVDEATSEQGRSGH
jgi:hypothetical protein